MNRIKIEKKWFVCSREICIHTKVKCIFITPIICNGNVLKSANLMYQQEHELNL